MAMKLFLLVVAAIASATVLAYEPDNQIKCDNINGCKGYPHGTFTYNKVQNYNYTRHKCDNPSQIAISFHDGPNVKTEELLARIIQKGFRATFFINGVMLDVKGKEVLKKIEDAGHTIAYGGMTTLALANLADGTYASFDALYEAEFKALDDAVAGTLSHGIAPYYFPKYRSYDYDLIDYLWEEKNIITVLPNLNFESPPTSLTQEQHIQYLYSEYEGGSTYRADTNSRMAGYMADASTQAQSYITQLSASQPKAEAFIIDYFYSTGLGKSYHYVDIKECLSYDINEFKDKRVPRCYGAPCESQSACRSRYNSCGSTTEYCNAESLYIPDCANDLSLGTSGTPTPTTSPTLSPTLSPTEYVPTTPTIPTYCDGKACDDLTSCRSDFNVCGEGSLYCNDDSLWKPECLNFTSPPTSMETVAIEPGPEVNPLECTGKPCEEQNQCRSGISGECGTSPEFCNVKSLWTSECVEQTGSGSLVQPCVAVLLLAAGTGTALFHV